MLFGRRAKQRDNGITVQEGALYRRIARGHVTETARVIAIGPDLMGIPHVRFWVRHEQFDASDELRTLALSAFTELFTEQVPA